ncbi:MAG: hypothetical protein AMS14_06640 [Planctomycetes bacterium DG_20]|nr:MAG: hypothetical protein AMS14_06640 [Planctomycetes bacterium DG_20]
MRIAFVKPAWRYPITKVEHTYNRRWPPLDLLNCGAIAERQGHDVQIVDAHVDGLSPEAVAERVGSADVSFVTSSALDRWQCPNLELEPVTAVTQRLRDGRARLFLMGFHGTVEPEAMLKMTGVDAVIRGEPEDTVRDLVSGRAIEDIDGVTFCRDGKVISTRDRAPVDMTALPAPAFHLVNPKRYRYEILGPRLMVLEGARGCPHPCTFCSRVIHGKRLRCKTVEQLGHEVEVAVRKHGVRTIFFHDLEFTASPEMAEGISRYILSRGIRVRWCCQTRPDLVEEPMLRLMERAGCRLIHFGLETGSERIAGLMRKMVPIERQRASLELARRMGLQTLCYFLLGYPGETEEEMLETIRLAKSLNPHYAVFHRISPYQGTALHEGLDGRTEDLFPTFAGTPEEREVVDRMVRRAFWEFYVRPRYVFSRLFRSSPPSLWRQLRLFAGYLR